MRSLRIKQAALGPDDPGVAQCLYNLAELYQELGQYAKAEPLYQQCLKIRETKLDRDHFTVSLSCADWPSCTCIRENSPKRSRCICGACKSRN